MAEFIGFVNIAVDDSYPVYVADEPIHDEADNEYSAHVDHAGHIIIISPRVPASNRNNEIEYAVSMARRTAALAPVAGGLE